MNFVPDYDANGSIEKLYRAKSAPGPRMIGFDDKYTEDGRKISMIK